MGYIQVLDKTGRVLYEAGSVPENLTVRTDGPSHKYGSGEPGSEPHSYNTREEKEFDPEAFRAALKRSRQNPQEETERLISKMESQVTEGKKRFENE